MEAQRERHYATRLYVDGTSAPKPEVFPQPQREVKTHKRIRGGAVQVVAVAPKASPVKRLLVIAATGAAAVSLFAVVLGNAEIAKRTTELNAVKSSISEAEKRIEDAQIELESSITVNEIRNRAKSNGMSIPNRENVFDLNP